VDLSVLAQNLPKLASIAGAFGGGSHASTAGVLAGLGDYQHQQNERAYQGVKSFADELEKITPDTWGEQAHEAAMQERLNLLNPKTIAKIYSNPGAADKLMQQAWQNVHAATARPNDGGAQQIDKNAAAGAIPAFQQQQRSAPAMSVLGSSASAAPMPGGMGGSMSQLGNLMGQASSQLGQSGERQANATIAAPPVPMRYGMLTPGEKAMRTYQSMQPFTQGQNGGGAGGGGGGGAAGEGWKMTMGPHGAQWTQIAPSYSVELHHLRDATGREYMGNVMVDHHGGPLLDANTRQPLASMGVTSLTKQRSDSIRNEVTVDADGNPVTQIDYGSNFAGKTLRRPVALADESITNNGVVQKFGRNRYTGKNTAPFATGTTPNRDIAEANLGLRQAANARAEQSNARANAAWDYTYGGWTTDVTGNITGVKGTRFTPAGTPIDAAGEPISKVGFAQTKAPAAVQTRARVSGDARDQADRMLQYLNDNPKLTDEFGPLEGRSMQWLVSKGIISGADIKGLQMQMASMESMNPAVHQMRNFAVAKDIADRLGDMGQPYENFKAGVQTLRDFYDQVAKSGVRPVVPTAKAPRAARPPANGATTPAGAAPSANTQTLQAIQKLLSGGP